MKSFKIILSIVGLALTSITFGQRLSQSDGSILFYTVVYNPTNLRMEHRLDEFPETRAYGDCYDVPLAARTYFGPMETDLAVESWMTTPFESNYYEVGPVVESWMTVPFDLDEEIELEEWMTTSWM